MDKLTAHQDEKKDEVLQADDVHLFAPAGAGKTFVALYCMLLALSQDPNNFVLFVVKNESLALFVVKWLCARFDGAVAKRNMLKRVHLLYEPCEDGPRAVELEGGRLSTKTAEVVVYVMITIDEAHHVHPKTQNLKPKSQNPNPKPQTPNPSTPQIPNPKPQTPQPKPPTSSTATHRSATRSQRTQSRFALSPAPSPLRILRLSASRAS
jgi:hypothetical protein